MTKEFYTISLTRWVKIWFSTDPNLFINEKNLQKLRESVTWSQRNHFTVLYSSKILNAHAIEQLTNLQREPTFKDRVEFLDIESSSFTNDLTEQEKRLFHYAQQELLHLNAGGCAAAASDIVRVLTPCFTKGNYTDFDVDINFQYLDALLEPTKLPAIQASTQGFFRATSPEHAEAQAEPMPFDEDHVFMERTNTCDSTRTIIYDAELSLSSYINEIPSISPEQRALNELREASLSMQICVSNADETMLVVKKPIIIPIRGDKVCNDAVFIATNAIPKEDLTAIDSLQKAILNRYETFSSLPEDNQGDKQNIIERRADILKKIKTLLELRQHQLTENADTSNADTIRPGLEALKKHYKTLVINITGPGVYHDILNDLHSHLLESVLEQLVCSQMQSAQNDGAWIPKLE